MRARLTKHPFARMNSGLVYSPSARIITWEVKPLDDVFIYGFNVGKTNQCEYWRITNRNGEYESADRALAILQEEFDHVHNQC